MTWGEFKEKLQQRGVTDDTPIDFIDYASVWGEDVNLTFNADGSATVETNYD